MNKDNDLVQKQTYEVILDYQGSYNYIWITCVSCNVHKSDDDDIYVIKAGGNFIEFDAVVAQITIPDTNEVVYKAAAHSSRSTREMRNE